MRSAVDLASFLMRAEWAILLSVGSFLVGSLPMLVGLPPVVGWAIAAAGFVVGVVFIVKDIFGLLGRWSEWSMRKVTAPVEFDGELVVPGLPQIVTTEVGRVAIDPDVDALLANSQCNVKWQSDPYELPSPLAEIAPYVLRTSAQGRWPFNGPNVRLESDISAEFLTDNRDVLMRPGNFYRGLCSNELTSWVITRGGTRWPFEEQFIFDSQHRIQALSQSQLLNGVGVSTLAVTTDDRLVIVLQSRNSQTSAGMWAPSGSGALEPQDVAASPDQLLVNVVSAGAVRELREEGNLSATAVGASEVIGYGRWLDRGAKPEFYCLTALTVASTELRLGSNAHRFGTEERTWTADIQLIELDFAGAQSRVDNDSSRPLWRSSLLVPNPAVLIGSVSVSLSLALDALVRALRRDPDIVSRLRGLGRASQVEEWQGTEAH
ncbi:hypothetical protein [Cryobacterium sp. BB307]|uniref:hypothetical protein n=1 Tax=Cryobacterium sp. BB307 TaxID=2716317 RepID=UPI0014481400|nr:hypothetical protein [Cryobacterium sp. BB307]